MAEHINKSDTLNEGRVKLNAAISDAEAAKVTAEGADVKSTQALVNSESTQTQLDTIVIEGDSSVEAAQARVTKDGETYGTLKERLDGEHSEVTQQLAQIAYNVTSHFGAKGDYNPSTGEGTDDTEAISTALESGYDLYLPGNYKITTPIHQIFTSDVKITGNGGKIYYVSENHTEYAIRLEGSGIKIEIENIGFEGNKMCNKVLEILNQTSTMHTETLSKLFIRNSNISKSKRLNTYQGGDGLHVRGSFSEVILDGVNVSDCELPFGQGTSGSIGISGVTLTHYGENSYIKKVIADNIDIEKVYSSDSGYSADQDGLRYLAPVESDSTLILNKSTFKDCYGRFIKTQIKTTLIDDSTFTNESVNSVGEVDVQYGGGSLSNSVFNLANEQALVVNSGGIPNQDGKGFNISNVDVYNDKKISRFFATNPREGILGVFNLSNIDIHGDIDYLVDYRINGDQNVLNVNRVSIKNLVGIENSLVHLKASGSMSRFRANINVSDSFYQGNNKPNLLLDRIEGVAAIGYLNAIGNIGFSEEQQISVNKLVPMEGYGFQTLNSYDIQPNQTISIDIDNAYGAMVFITFETNQNSYGQFYSRVTSNTPIAIGSLLTLGNNEEPEGANTLKVWTPQIRIMNIKNDRNARIRLILFVIGTI